MMIHVAAKGSNMKMDITRAEALRLFALGAVSVSAGLFVGAARAADGVKLFKIVSARDEIVIGVTDKDIAGSDGSDLAKLAAKMKSTGQFEAWRYAVKKADNGDLQQAPSTRVMLIWSDTLRIEPYVSPLKVLPPA
jgi:hypothetical protein